MPPRIELTREAARTVKALKPNELASYRRLLDLLRKYTGIGVPYMVASDGTPLQAVFGMGVYIVYDHRVNYIRIVYIGFWEPPQQR